VSPRYAMPALPAVAVLAGLAFDEWRDRFGGAWAGILWIGAALAIYPLVAGWIVAPLLPSVAQKNRITAYAADQAVRTQPGTVFGVFWSGGNVLAHMDAPIRLVRNPEALKQLAAGNWVFAHRAEIAAVASARPDVRVLEYVVAAAGSGDDQFVLARLAPR